MPEQLAVDVSNYQGAPAQEVFDSWYAAGARTIICGTDGSGTSPLVFPQQAAKAKAAGMAVEAYIYLYFGANGVPNDVLGRTNQKLDLIDSVGDIKRVWIDCEDTTSGLGAGHLVDIIGQAVDAAARRGYQVGIYTGAWWWVPYTGNDARFASLPLWSASYDDQQSLYFLNRFGGWRELHRKQYTEKGRLGTYAGDLDLNWERGPEIVVPPVIDPFQRGRSEVFFKGWKRDTVPVLRESAARLREEAGRLDEHADWVEARPDEWGIPEVA